MNPMSFQWKEKTDPTQKVGKPADDSFIYGAADGHTMV